MDTYNPDSFYNSDMSRIYSFNIYEKGTMIDKDKERNDALEMIKRMKGLL